MGAYSEFLRRPYYGDILSGVYDEAYRQGQRIRFFHFLGRELHDPPLFNEHVHPEEISALIFSALRFSDKSSKPCAHRTDYRTHQKCDLSGSLDCRVALGRLCDQSGGSRTATRHLITLGHEQIGFVGKHDNRVEGYRQALLEHGLPYQEHLLRHPGEQKEYPEEGYAGPALLEAAL